MIKWERCKTTIEYHGKLPQRPQICPLRIYKDSPLCPTGHRPFGAAALLSLHFISGSLPAGHRVPLTMCDPWMTSSLPFLLPSSFIYLNIPKKVQNFKILLRPAKQKMNLNAAVLLDYIRWNLNCTNKEYLSKWYSEYLCTPRCILSLSMFILERKTISRFFLLSLVLIMLSPAWLIFPLSYFPFTLLLLFMCSRFHLVASFDLRWYDSA